MTRCPLLLSQTLATAFLVAQEPSLTIYNDNFAVVRERIALDLKQGANEVTFVGVTSQLEADSVVLRDPTNQVAFTITEQSYRADMLSQGLLMQRHEGKELDFLTMDRDGRERIVRGKVIRSGFVTNRGYDQYNGTIIEVDGAVRFGMPGTPQFPPIGAGEILLPTLHWRVHAAEAAALAAEVSYVTGGLTWQASYNLVAPEHGDTMDVVGWVTIGNQSGKVFPEARIKLMAGDVHKLQPLGSYPSGVGGPSTGGPSAPSPLPAVTQKSFDEMHLYSLPLPTTLNNQESKQVELARAMQVTAPRIYVYNGGAWYGGWSPWAFLNQPEYGTRSNPKVWVMRELANTKANGLGIPLPKGRTRFYRRDDADGRLEFVGENMIDHTPTDEVLRIYTGDAFDVVGERKCTDTKVVVGRVCEEALEIRVRNHKKTPVEVRVYERLWRWSNWQIVEQSHEHAKLDAASIEFRVAVPAHGESVVTYRVRYDW